MSLFGKVLYFYVCLGYSLFGLENICLRLATLKMANSLKRAESKFKIDIHMSSEVEKWM